MSTLKRSTNQVENNSNQSKKRKKKNVSALEYFKINSPNLFTKSLLSSSKIVSMSRENLDKHRAKKDLSKSNHYLVTSLINSNILSPRKHKHLIEAMLQVDKKYYCLENNLSCYVLPKDLNTSTVSKSMLYAQACILLYSKLKPGSKVLEVGTGSGLMATIIANMINCRGDIGIKRGEITSLDISSEKVEKALENVNSDTINRDLLLENNRDYFKFVEGNGKTGYPEKLNKKLYDVINVSASHTETEAPAYLKYQLREGGLMFIPVRLDNNIIIRLYQRTNGKIKYMSTTIKVDDTMSSSELE